MRSAPNRESEVQFDSRGVLKGTLLLQFAELQLAKRMSHGFQVQGTFTWGRSIDTSSATGLGDPFGNSISSLNYFDTRLTRGSS